MPIRTAQYDEFGPRFAVIDGEIPSASDFKRLRKEGLCIHVLSMPANEHTVDFLEPVADVVQELRVHDYACNDIRTVERMPALRRLGLRIDPRVRVDLTRAEKLEAFAGPWKYMESVIECIGLTELRISNPPSGQLDDVKSSLVRLDIFGATKLSEVPRVAASTDLQRLTIFRARSIDLAPAVHYAKLQRLELDSCKRVLSGQVLLEMRNLEEIVLEKCPQIDGWESLEGLHGPRVKVIDKNPFDSQFRTVVAPGGNWTFPPGPGYLPPSRRT